VTAGTGEAANVSSDKNGFSAFYGIGAGGSGKVDVGVGGNIRSWGSQPAYTGLGTQFSASLGFVFGLSVTSTQTATGTSTSIDWNFPSFGLSAFAGVGAVSQTCGG
jgi:hypothetical protein